MALFKVLIRRGIGSNHSQSALLYELCFKLEQGWAHGWAGNSSSGLGGTIVPEAIDLPRRAIQRPNSPP
ncbi:hypothetical protein SUGI_1225220 [Cryptomeria japonica]|uniref:Uncharacterized protein n=1 Tax=Cryptomeria japonica TaxID=3369 RepID=A0AAD3NJH9_CRYJA|nr:hypothetical protein SUGI_1225220 [Cryptomeria japonica]